MLFSYSQKRAYSCELSHLRTPSNSDCFPTITSLLKLVTIELLCLGRHDLSGNKAAPTSSFAEYWTCFLRLKENSWHTDTDNQLSGSFCINDNFCGLQLPSGRHNE